MTLGKDGSGSWIFFNSIQSKMKRFLILSKSTFSNILYTGTNMSLFEKYVVEMIHSSLLLKIIIYDTLEISKQHIQVLELET